MPELPEVETIAGDLNKKVAGKTIKRVWFDAPRMIKYPKNPRDFERDIKNTKILEVRRRAKYIKMFLDKDRALLIHPKMTGHILLGTWNLKHGTKSGKKIWVSPDDGAINDKVNSYIHFIFYLDDGSMMAMSDVRKFGTLRLGRMEEIENLKEIKNLGPEPLGSNFKVDDFIGLLHLTKRKIKQVLIDPSVIVGIGNIYSDEVLWDAKIYPLTPANEISKKKSKTLFGSIQKILKKSIKLRGTSMSDYRDTNGEKGGYYAERLIYHREGEKCLRCGSIVKRIKIGGRSAHYCPKCQLSRHGGAKFKH